METVISSSYIFKAQCAPLNVTMILIGKTPKGIRKRLLLILPFAVGAIACTTELTPGAQQVRQISTLSAENCSFLGPVSGTEYFGLSVAGDTASAMNKARNRVAELGGNSFVLSNTNSSGDATIVQADAYLCP